MSEKVEQVARIIYERTHAPSLRWEDSEHQPAWRLAARAVIEAMREPTEAMTKAGNACVEWANGADDAWEAMIDEMLK